VPIDGLALDLRERGNRQRREQAALQKLFEHRSECAKTARPVLVDDGI
jgi:hypothetical protein